MKTAQDRLPALVNLTEKKKNKFKNKALLSGGEMCCEKKIIKGDRNEHKRCCYFPSCLKGAASLTR